MSLLKWSKDRSVYLPEIDEEHRGLLLIVEELHKSILTGGKAEQVKPILVNLLDAADDHFRSEERLMRVVHYSAFDWHKKQHETLRKRMKQMIKRIDAGDPDAAAEMLAFLTAWFTDHMSVADQMMGAFVRNYLRFNTSLAS